MGISMGKWPDFEYHGGKWLKYDWSGFSSSHPSLGSPLMVWCIKLTSSGTFRSFPTCLEMAKMDINLHLSPMPVSHIQVVDLSSPIWSSFICHGQYGNYLLYEGLLRRQRGPHPPHKKNHLFWNMLASLNNSLYEFAVGPQTICWTFNLVSSLWDLWDSA